MSKMTCEMTALVCGTGAGAGIGIASSASADGIGARCDAEEIYWCGDPV